MSKQRLPLFLLALAGIQIVLAACSGALFDTPPRIATQTAAAGQLSASPTASLTETESHSAPTPSPDAIPINPDQDSAPPLRLWVNESSPAHLAVLEQMSADFTDKQGVFVELSLIKGDLLPELVAAAVLSGTLPDLIVHPIDYSIGWYERGILDAAAATETLQQLDAGTFNPAALDALAVPDQPQQIVALPSDGWKQMLIYRADWFSEKGLRPPDSYGAMLTAVEAISDTADLISGLVIPTESSLRSTHTVFEQWSAGNGCQLIDEKGEIVIQQPRCLDALVFYRDIINQYSPSDVQTDTSALNAYLEGRTSIIAASPAALPILAGLDAGNQPRCPECASNYLAQNSGFVLAIKGNSVGAHPAQFSQINALGIVVGAPPAAQLFAQYWFEEGYLSWLSVEPERKVPMRWGESDNPEIFLSEWERMPIAGSSQTLSQLYSPQLTQQLAAGISPADRWGFSQRQGGIVTKLAEENTLSLLLQEMLSGYFSPEQTIAESYNRVIDLIPNYKYHSDPQPTPTSTP